MSNEKYVFPQDTTCINLQLTIFLILFCLSYFFIRITSHDFFVNEMNNCNIVLQLFCADRQNLSLPQTFLNSSFKKGTFVYLNVTKCENTTEEISGDHHEM